MEYIRLSGLARMTYLHVEYYSSNVPSFDI